MKFESKNAKNLHEQRKSTYTLVDQYHKRYIDQTTGKLFKKFSEERKCPVCNSDKRVFILDKSASTYYKCEDCTMVYLNPIMNKNTTIEYYTNLNTGQGDIVSGESQFYTEIYSLGLDSIEKNSNKKGKILDIVCSTGFFIDLAKKRGWETTGIELGSEEASIAEKKGHRIIKEVIEELEISEKYDAIVMWDVLEHIPNGIEQLELISRHLNKGGILFFQVPNSDSLAAKILRYSCRMFDGIEHTNLYNPKSLEKLINNSNFSVLNISSVISEIAVINNFLDYLDPYFGTSQYSDKVLNFIDEKTIHDNKIGYKLQVTLVRK